MTTTAANVPRQERASELYSSEWYTGSLLAAVIDYAHQRRITGKMIVHLSQGSPSMVEICQKIVPDLTS